MCIWNKTFWGALFGPQNMQILDIGPNYFWAFGTKTILFSVFCVLGPQKMKILIITHSQRPPKTFLWQNKIEYFCSFFAVFLSFFCNFGPQKMQMLVMGHPHMTFGGIWSKLFFFKFWHFWPRKWAFFIPQICNFCKFWSKETPNDFRGHLEGTFAGKLWPPKWAFLTPKICTLCSWETTNDIWGKMAAFC